MTYSLSRRNPEKCYVCDEDALEGVNSDKGPVCYKHALGHMGRPVGEDEEERACRACRRPIGKKESRAYVADVGFFHETCLKAAIQKLGKCPKCGGQLDHGDCRSCWGGIGKWIEQAVKDAEAVVGSKKRLCVCCLRHNKLIGPGYPFYPVTPNAGTMTCSSCFQAICGDHHAYLPEKNVLGLSTEEVYCSGLPYGGSGTTCYGQLEAKVACSVEGCDTERDARNYDALTEAEKCEKCDRWFCGREHEAKECPDCVGVRCERCNELKDQDSLHDFQTDSTSFEKLCEDCVSARESEEEDSDWDNFVRRDFETAVRDKFELDEDYWDSRDVQSEPLRELWKDKGGYSRYNDSNVHDAANDVEWDDLAQFGINNDTLFDWEWGHGTKEDFLERLVTMHPAFDTATKAQLDRVDAADDEKVRALYRIGDGRTAEDGTLAQLVDSLTVDEVRDTFSEAFTQANPRRRR